MKSSYLLIGLFLSGQCISESAYRDPKLDYSIYMNHYEENKSLDGLISPKASARLFGSSVLPKATGWKYSELQKRFEQLRDTRFLKSQKQKDFLRRPSWLYPDDGCWARAALANRNFFRWFNPIPKKIFAFGNLRVKTKNSPRGSVSWWYHVAPIVETEGEKYVLDPSIEYTRPLKLKEWLERMGRPSKIKVAICDSGTYSPGDDCYKNTDGIESRAERAQLYYLNLEWNRLKKLGRLPEKELGDRPPWVKAIQP